MATVRREATAAEAKALANPLRLRILRLCLDEGLTNKELAARLDKDPGTLLHHVRTLVGTGFLASEAVRSGPSGALEKPYRATGKSWEVSIGEETPFGLAPIDAVRAEVADVGETAVEMVTRLAFRLAPAQKDRLVARLSALAEEYAAAQHPDAEPYGLFVILHRRQP
jgi:DNA-binding transcriptional ArsR family regulator